MPSDLLEELKWRGLIDQVTHSDITPGTCYCGFDPTATSLHAGSLVPLVVMAHFRRHGHKAISVVGGATGMIGDPSGKSTVRNLLSAEDLLKNIKGVQGQIQFILDNALTINPTGLVGDVEHLNNADWTNQISFIDLLRDVGTHFRVNQMLSKDSVKSRLTKDQGISYTEFSYMILQAFDFLHLFKTSDCKIQIGGSDQWGNITAGIDLIHKKLSASAHGITLPLLTNSKGQKMGKTEEGALWLDPIQMDPLRFFQYWVHNVTDQDVIPLMKKLTFLSREDISEHEAFLASGKNQGELQFKLAWNITSWVHGRLVADNVSKVSPKNQDTLPTFKVEAQATLVDVLVGIGSPNIKSRNDARRMISQGAVSLDGKKASEDISLALEEGKSFILKVGKNQILKLHR